jgi:hypothetical protein
MPDTVKAEIGKRYLTRQRGVVGPLYCRDPEEEPDHLNFDGRSWHLDGTCCGSGKEFDLIQEFK